MLSIRGNWDDAIEEHDAYVRARVDAAIKHHVSRAQVGAQIRAFLAAIAPYKASDMKALLSAIPGYVTILDGLPTSAAQNAFRRRVGVLGGPPPADKPTGAVKQFLRLVGKLDKTALVAVLNAFEAQRAACAVPGDTAFLEHIQRDLVTRASNKPHTYLAERFVPYVQQITVMSHVDALFADFLRVTGQRIGAADFDFLLVSVAVYVGYRRKCNSKAARAMFAENVARVFDYDEFTDRDNGWNAYALCNASRTRTCPYCNQAYAFTVVRAKGKRVRPTLDHFLPKHRFPHLALSINNLIPSCYTCNSNLKHKTDFRRRPHLHPLYDDEAIHFRMTVPTAASPFPLDSAGFLDLVANFDRVMRDAKLELDIAPKSKKALNSAETFLLEDRYKHNLPEALSFIELHVKSRVSEVEELFWRAGLSPAKVLRFDPHDHPHSLLGKMYQDLHRQFLRPDPPPP